MSLKDQITEDMKAAMRAKDSERLGTIRLLLAAVKLRLLRWRRTPHAIPCDHPQINPSPPIPASAVVADPAAVEFPIANVVAQPAKLTLM